MSGEPRKSEILTTKLDYGTELFVDDLLIDTRRGVKRTLHPAQNWRSLCSRPSSPGNRAARTSQRGLTYTARLCLTSTWTSIGCGTCVAWALCMATRFPVCTSHVPDAVKAPRSWGAAKTST